MGLVLDTSVLLAALDSSDPDHGRCAELIAGSSENLLIPALVLSELDYWCQERLTLSVWLAFLEDVLAGAYSVENPTDADLKRCLELQHDYADLAVGIVDASLLALAERLGERKVATLDHRHFATMRPSHVEALQLLPE